MSHTINLQYIFLTWPTKNLRCCIHGELQNSLPAYISRLIHNSAGRLLANSIAPNHIHLLIKLPTDMAVADFVREIKSKSSVWCRTLRNPADFYWEEGYSAFTIGLSSIDRIIEYLDKDEIRHTTLTYQDELIAFLRTHGIAFKPEYLTNTTYTRLVFHLVWAVKNREPMLVPSFQTALHSRISQEVSRLGGIVYAIGNIEDHIHLLLESSSIISTAKLMQQVKTVTTHLIKAQDKKCGFTWQEGYGTFSVAMSSFENVKQYVNNQEVHHKTKSFDEEWEWFKSKKSC